MKILILPSVDGPDHSEALLYPRSWPRDRAIMKAKHVLADVKRFVGEEWSLEDLYHGFRNAGFKLPDEVTVGPAWDDPEGASWRD